jgi:hypothetical protein
MFSYLLAVNLIALISTSAYITSALSLGYHLKHGLQTKFNRRSSEFLHLVLLVLDSVHIQIVILLV